LTLENRSGIGDSFTEYRYQLAGEGGEFGSLRGERRPRRRGRRQYVGALDKGTIGHLRAGDAHVRADRATAEAAVEDEDLPGGARTAERQADLFELQRRPQVLLAGARRGEEQSTVMFGAQPMPGVVHQEQVLRGLRRRVERTGDHLPPGVE